MEIRYLTPDNAVFRETEGRLLAVAVSGEEYPVVYLHRSFPHTNQRIHISVRTPENKEVGMIRSLDDFPKETVELLERHIQLRYFAPSITKVLEIREEFGYSFWETETTAGPRRFTVGRGSNVRIMGEKRLLITDVDGNRYIIENLDQLSEKEYRMVEMSL